MGVRVKPLLSLRIEVGSVTLQDAQVELVERGGRWNFAALSAAPAPAKPPTRTVPGIPGSAAMGSVFVSRVGLKNAVVNVRRPDVKNGDLRLEGLDATLSGVGGSELGLRGDARLQPGDLRLRNVEATGSHLTCVNPRDFSADKNRKVDDRPFGGGPGMLGAYVRCGAFLAAA